jgi:hypothetical protein
MAPNNSPMAAATPFAGELGHDGAHIAPAMNANLSLHGATIAAKR